MVEKNPSKFKYAARGGNSGMYKDGIVYGGSSACIRKAQLRHHGVNESDDGSVDWRRTFTFSVGNSIEPIVAERERFESGVKIGEDVLIEWSPKDSPTDGFTGHMDIVYLEEKEPGYAPIIEHKTIQSLSRCKETMVSGGKWKEHYLYQLGKYMMYSRNKNGILMFTMTFNSNAFSKHGEKYNFKAMDSKNFYVSIRKDGGLLVGESREEMEYIGVDVQDLHEHTLLTLEWLKKDEVYPYPPENRFTNEPGCQWCPFQKTCEKVERGNITDMTDFIKDIKSRQSQDELLKQEMKINSFSLFSK